LSGIEQEDSMVVLFPNCPDPKYREVLVLVRPNELKEKWDGKRLRTADGAAISGIQTIVWLDAIDAMLQTWVHLADTIYLDTNENDRKATEVASRDYRFVAEMKARYPLHGYERAAKIMRTLRAVKSKEEVAVIAKAIDITDQTFRHLLGFIKPGVTEYEIEAEIYHHFLKRRQQVRLTIVLLQVEIGQEHFIMFQTTRYVKQERCSSWILVLNMAVTVPI
jgi:Xaa-Pro aminopeptidase